MNDLQGWLNVYKPLNITSFFVIRKLKKKFNLKKIGHAGTLDPLAEGILPVAIGKATKLIPFINEQKKEYEFEIRWGIQTTTDDREGLVIAKSDYIPSYIDLKKELKNFIGVIGQYPPKASSVKIDGIRAYKLMRQNIDFKTKEKKVKVFSVKILNSNKNDLSKIRIICGKGFYVRSFARDIAEKLGTKGHIFSLKRTKVGKFDLKSTNLLDDLLKIRQTLPEFKGFHPSISMLDDILAYEIVDEKDLINISQGKSININLNGLVYPPLYSLVKDYVFLTNKKKVISIGKLDENLFKPLKVLI